MGRMSERGEGKLGTVVGLVVFVAVALAIWNTGPVFFADYAFKDKLNTIARASRFTNTDEKLMDQVRKAAEEEKLEGYINRETCKINTLETRRTIRCEYDRTVEILPGIKHTFHFKDEVEQPLI